jgi:uncharacterized damage-inducible protein DinB
MSETRRIISQLRRAYEGEAWHGPSVCELLDGVTADQAARRPIPTAHTIWELVLHIAAWERAARRRIIEWTAEDVRDEENFPAIPDTSEAAWSAAREELRQTNSALREAISALQDSDLERMIERAPYSAYFLLHGVVQHDLYHAGQIALLKKAV